MKILFDWSDAACHVEKWRYLKMKTSSWWAARLLQCECRVLCANESAWKRRIFHFILKRCESLLYKDEHSKIRRVIFCNYDVYNWNRINTAIKMQVLCVCRHFDQLIDRYRLHLRPTFERIICFKLIWLADALMTNLTAVFSKPHF